MKVFGIDFTSNPSASGSKAKAAKWMYLATCELDSNHLVVDSLERLNGKKNGDYSQLVSKFNSAGRWVAGIDVPFGMPIECIEYFEWLRPEDTDQNWATYVGRIRSTENRKEFKSTIESWRHPTKTNSSGDKERVRKYRVVDKRIGAQSPMNCIRPPVGSMFFEACELLRSVSASIPPVRLRDDAECHIVEAYPRLVADRLIGSSEYKEADDLEDVRKQIVTQLVDSSEKSIIRDWYGFTLKISDAIAAECIADWDGDRIDSILCAVQAAWAARQNNFGIPQFASSVMNQIVALEGWVPDPFLGKWRAPQ